MARRTLQGNRVAIRARPRAVLAGSSGDARGTAGRDHVGNVRAGSSGPPEQAAELAATRRAMPFLIQLPTAHPVAKGIMIDNLELLEIDIDAAALEGLPSMQAINAVDGSPPQAPGSDPDARPARKAPEGEKTRRTAARRAPGPQPGLTGATMTRSTMRLDLSVVN